MRFRARVRASLHLITLVLYADSISGSCLATDGQPSLPTLRAFMASTAQGISYHRNVWHAPLIALGDRKVDFACVVSETGVPEVDCEIKWFEQGTVAVVEAV